MPSPRTICRPYLEGADGAARARSRPVPTNFGGRHPCPDAHHHHHHHYHHHHHHHHHRYRRHRRAAAAATAAEMATVAAAALYPLLISPLMSIDFKSMTPRPVPGMRPQDGTAQTLLTLVISYLSWELMVYAGHGNSMPHIRKLAVCTVPSDLCLLR